MASWSLLRALRRFIPQVSREAARGAGGIGRSYRRGCSNGTGCKPRTSRLEEVTQCKTNHFDAVIVGGGHNGLVAAAYLARAGMKPLVLEQRDVLGGAAVSEEIVPGYVFSRASYLYSLFHPDIVRDLELETKYGLTLYPRDPSSFSPLLDGSGYLLFSRDVRETQRSIASFSERDALMYPKYEHKLERIMEGLVKPLMERSPVQLSRMSWSDMRFVARMVLACWKHRSDLPDALQLLLAPAEKVLRQYFESEPLLSTLATDALIGTMTAPSQPGSGYVLLHHVAGESKGVKGAWSYVRGGMGALSNAIAFSAQAHGATLVTGAAVQEICFDDHSGMALGVRLQDGSEIRTERVISNADAKTTFLKLCAGASASRAGVFSSEFLDRIRALDFRSPVLKINAALNAVPEFRATASSNLNGKERRATIHLGCSSLEELNHAFHEASTKNAQPSTWPMIEMTIPSELDDSLAPPGHAVAGLFVQFAPYDADWDSPGFKEAYCNHIFSIVDQYAPGFSDSIVGYEALSPRDLERTFGLHGGNIFHGSMSLDQVYSFRPVLEASAYTTPAKRLYLCGSSSHPGGGVSGMPGKFCAERVLAERRM
ncbi:Pyridine nucleotide-disulfide oxidoreductase domain-containing protein 2 [Porphyridium purpureum]|uniref:Pyridine nucleotide-disulfide oxidoreductase domain-containing protein 2 n=1 Tax=Porphyridium purpureum TaxID=35688 RepID=A0A5J4YLT6_PORPP|nr:Pyridine nucleotide-disulfide oxidoreductase domain-containing protein 2 [Porphyridium purpureum]|eukprot:POR3026..scf295_9